MLRVYMDLVMVLNFLVDFLLILGTNRLAGYPAGAKRGAIAAALGGIYGGMCMAPGFRFLGNTLWRLVSLTLMAVLAFGWNRSALQRGAVFVLLSMALGGIALGLGDGTFWMLVLSAGAVWLLCRFSFRGSLGAKEYVPVELGWEGKTIRLIALRDTGNTLRDPLTGERVLVAGADVAQELIGLTEHQLQHPVETLASCGMPGLRLIPYQAVGQPGGMLLALRFRDAKIGKNTESPLVAFAPQVLARGEAYRMLTGGVV
ncbi:MAG: sigma-E processing peptidase SpoIIGA [Oscillospiraceae bacterium]|nr:sigma-E processing peptidase SpoIIGA [Oscillospiraceae bacterium]